MPCYSPSYVHSKGDAILCSVFHKLEKMGYLDMWIDSLDYNLIGVPKDQVCKWWEDNKRLDSSALREQR